MVSGGKVSGRRNVRRRVGSQDGGSDDSDEDYVVSDEEIQVTDDDFEYCSSLDEREESIDNFVEDEDEEEEKEVNREVIRPTVRRGSFAKEKGRSKSTQKRKRVSCEEDDDEDYEVEEEEEEEVKREATRPPVRRGSFAKEEDEDYEGEEEEEEEEEEVRREVARPKVRQGSFVKEENEDYEGEEEEEDEVRMKVVRPSVRRGSFAKEEDEDYEWEEEEAKEIRRDVSRPIVRGSGEEEKARDKSTAKRKHGSSKEDADEDYEGEEEEEEEDDDEEFVVDEDDCLDEEEEPTLTRKKTTNASKRGLKRKGPRGGRRNRKKHAVAKEPARKRGLKKRRLKRKARVVVDNDEEFDYEDDGDGDGDFRGRVPVVRKRSKTKLVHRRNGRVSSDSDHVSSGSSYHEYTISEEEREQIMEAEKLCASAKPALRSSSSMRKTQSAEDLSKFKKPPVKRGKEKVEEVKIEVVKQVCGICLSEEDKRRLRGTLDCCSHYFCFTCIMEWSRVESRCPLCKQRFKTISKPARLAAGVDLREVVIQVPERDQVYQPSEEELRSYLDPYENVICSECHQGGDDGLMLLCDLCDSSAHTYCVGLGRVVPEGNWYCEVCRPVAMVSSSSRAQDPLSDQRTVSNLYNRSSPIVNLGESVEPTMMSSPRTPFSPGFGGLVSPRLPVTDVPAASPMLGAGAPTLSGRRMIHRHIQSLLSGNRMNLMAMRGDGIPTPNSTNDFLTSQIAQQREATAPQSRMQEHGISSTTFEESPRGDPLTSLQSRGIFPPRLVNPRREVVEGPSTTTMGASFNLNLWPEHAGINSVPGINHLNPSSARSNTGFIGSPCIGTKEDGNLSMTTEQLQSMVRNHLKILSRDIDLGNSFQDIARHSTHTILAACGLEHIRSEVHTVPQPSICPHIERLHAGQLSLMKGCCSTCFDSFVKDVVKRIMDTSLPQWLSLGL